MGPANIQHGMESKRFVVETMFKKYDSVVSKGPSYMMIRNEMRMYEHKHANKQHSSGKCVRLST